MEDFFYHIKCSKLEFESLKTDERFLSLLTLARVVNALRFCQKAAIDAKTSLGPSSARSSINSALFASSVMYEGLQVASILGKYFKELDSFKNGFGVLLKDEKVKKFQNTILKRMRNKFVFHFDKEVMGESFGQFDLSEYIFASGYGKTSGEMYFQLADEAVINYLLNPAEDEPDESLMDRFKTILQNTTELMDRFTEATEILMGEVLIEMGFSKESVTFSKRKQR